MTEADLQPLRQEYLRLVQQELPAAAQAAKPPWPIERDHCFMRVVLDNLLGRCWYEVLDRRRPAYRQLTDVQLHDAIALARQMLADPLEVERLNHRSLQYRGKRA